MVHSELVVGRNWGHRFADRPGSSMLRAEHRAFRRGVLQVRLGPNRVGADRRDYGHLTSKKLLRLLLGEIPLWARPRALASQDLRAPVQASPRNLCARAKGAALAAMNQARGKTVRPKAAEDWSPGWPQCRRLRRACPLASGPRPAAG